MPVCNAFQTSPAANTKTGSMLGLWLIYWVIELSEGPIAVEAREGSGNRIRVRLPYGRGGNGNCGRFLSR